LHTAHTFETQAGWPLAAVTERGRSRALAKAEHALPPTPGRLTHQSRATMRQITN